MGSTAEQARKNQKAKAEALKNALQSADVEANKKETETKKKAAGSAFASDVTEAEKNRILNLPTEGAKYVPKDEGKPPSTPTPTPTPEATPTPKATRPKPPRTGMFSSGKKRTR